MTTKGSKIVTVTLVSIVLLGSITLNAYLYIQNRSIDQKLSATTTKLQMVSDSLAQIQNQNSGLSTALNDATAKNMDYSAKLNAVNSTVESYERKASIDPQILYKYSKIFFLNENYKPVALTEIDTKFLYDKSKKLYFHDRAWLFLFKLLSDAENSGIDLKVISAYRSFGTQAILKSSYKVTYGAGTANAFSADQGYSEHQLGTALDFTTPKVGATFSGFDKSDAYKWLQANAYRYGFILSYPKGNSYYTFEPWHWRFVGLDLAKYLHDKNISFYDMDQREINTYLEFTFNGELKK